MRSFGTTSPGAPNSLVPAGTILITNMDAIFGNLFDMRMAKNIVLGQAVSRSKLELAKLLRKEMTLPEKLLWKKVRRNSLEGFHFRRQQIIAGFVVDFYCHEARLAIELDGRVHDAQREYDVARDQVIATYDVSVLRFKNESVTESLDLVLDRILLACKTRTNKTTQ